jgi:hypothetical protein
VILGSKAPSLSGKRTMSDRPASVPASQSPDLRIRKFRHILLWPVQLMPLKEGTQIQNHWERLAVPDCPWQELADEFTVDCTDFKERHYIEFVAFLPYVQRFLYGEGATTDSRPGYGASPIHVFRRTDVAKVRITVRADEPTITFSIAHIDLYFFYDIDVAILVVEIHGEDMTLAQVHDTMFRFGRVYPTFWNTDGSAGHCCHLTEWIARDGTVLARSDFERKDQYLASVCRHRAPHIGSHWAFLLRPLALHHSGESGSIRYRLLEYQRMPQLTYLALDDPHCLERADWVRLGLSTSPGSAGSLPFAPAYLTKFEALYCYDRFWNENGESDGLATRMICSGHAFLMVGSDATPFYTDAETGLLGQFRHQYFLLGLIAHFQRAALLMLSDRLVVAISRLDIANIDSVKHFKRDIRQLQEIFLRFTHRYWFHEVSNREPARDLFRLWTDHLSMDRLFAEVREEVQDMSHYLDSDGLRRQANSVVRLTVVTIFGLVGTLVTGFLGMNLIAAAEEPLWLRALFFLVVLIPLIALILYTIVKSKRLSDFLEALSDERLSNRQKFRHLLKVRDR